MRDGPLTEGLGLLLKARRDDGCMRIYAQKRHQGRLGAPAPSCTVGTGGGPKSIEMVSLVERLVSTSGTA